MSGVFMDGGGGDSLNYGGDGIDHGGHDHGGHGVQHGHGQGGHNFLAQILGLDQADHAHLAHHGGEGAEGAAPSQTASWNSALQGLKLENLIAGINITPNFLLFMLFASFVGWLGVIYWIRHHEPFANQVLGSSCAYAPTVGADRKLINGCRDANPIKTSSQSGIVYCPQPGQNSSSPPAGSQTNASLSAAMASAFGQGQSNAAAVTGQSMAALSGSSVNQGLSAAMGAAGAAPGQSNGPAPNQSYVAPGQSVAAGSSVNQGLSAAMSAALGPAASAAGSPQGAPGQAYSGAPGYQPAGQPGQQYAPAMAQTMPMAASSPMGGGAPMSGMGMREGGMRLFSSRTMPMASPMAGAPPMASPGMREGGMRLFSSRRSMMAAAPQMPAQAPPQAAQYDQAAAMPQAQPVENPNTWSLATQGNGSFSADTAQFSSQFGAPIEVPATEARSASTGNLTAPGLKSDRPAAAAYTVSTPEGTRLKVVTDK